MVMCLYDHEFNEKFTAFRIPCKVSFNSSFRLDEGTFTSSTILGALGTLVLVDGWPSLYLGLGLLLGLSLVVEARNASS